MAGSWWRRPRNEARGGRVGVAFGADGVALAHIVAHAGEGPARLLVCEVREGAGPHGPWLAERVRSHGLAGLPCTAVLPPHAVRMRLVDAPRVPEEELREAARWLVGDALDFDAGSAAIDVLGIDAEETRNRQPRICVVAAEARAAEEAAEAVRSARLALEAVDIRERAWLRLAQRDDASGAVDAVLFLGRKEGCVALGQGERVFLSRDLPLGVEAVEDDAWDAGVDRAERERAMDLLVLDVQRLLDYHESTFEHSGPTRLWVAPAESDLSEAVRHLSEVLRVDVGALEPGARIDLGSGRSQSLLSHSLAAIGAALPPGSGPRLDLRPRRVQADREPLSALRMATAVAAAALLVLGLAGYEASRTWALESAQREAAARVAGLAERVGAVEVEVAAARLAPAALQERIAELRAARDARAAWVQALAPAAPGEGLGVASVLEGLAHARVPDVWLREIHVRDHGARLDLAGSTLEPDGVARLLQRLAEQGALEGRGFRMVHMARDEKEPWRLDFELQSGGGRGP